MAYRKRSFSKKRGRRQLKRKSGRRSSQKRLGTYRMSRGGIRL